MPFVSGWDESSYEKFYSNTFTIRPLTASFSIFLETCLSMSCSSIIFFLIGRVKLIMNCVSPPLSNMNCFYYFVLITILFQSRVWAIWVLTPWPNLVTSWCCEGSELILMRGGGCHLPAGISPCFCL